MIFCFGIRQPPIGWINTRPVRVIRELARRLMREQPFCRLGLGRGSGGGHQQKSPITSERQLFFDDFPRQIWALEGLLLPRSGHLAFKVVLSCAFGRFRPLLVLSITFKVIEAFPDGVSGCVER